MRTFAGIVLCLGVLRGLGAQPAGPEERLPYWAVGADGEGEPLRPPLAQVGKPAAEPLLLWQEGRGFASAGRGEPLPREIAEGPAVEVVVRDGSGSPAAGLPLEYRPAGWPNLPEPMGRVTTDTAGRARIFLPQGDGVLLWIAAPAYLPGTVAVELAGKSVDLVAQEAPPGSVRLEGPFGQALAGASVLLLSPQAPRNPLRLVRERASAALRQKADAQGFLSLGADVASVPLLAWAKGYRLAEVPPRSRPVKVPLSKAAPVRLRVAGPGGRVVPWRAEARYAHLGLPWLAASEEWSFTAPAGRVFPQGYPCTVVVRAEGCAEAEIPLQEAPSGELAVSLSRAVTLSGHVRDEAGNPVAGARVCLGSPGGRPFALTDGEGHFALPPQPAEDGPWDLYAEADDYLQGELRGVPAEKAASCAIVLSRGGGITGRVELKGGGEAPKGFRVRVTALSGMSSQGASFDARTAEDGSFSVYGLDEGTYRVEALARGRRSAPATVEVKEGPPADAGTLLLDLHPTVSGRLVARGGEALDARDAEVRLVRSLGPREIATEAEAALPADLREEDGTFACWGVPEGSYRVEAHLGGLAGRSAPFRVDGQGDVDAGTLALAREVTLRGRLAGRVPRDWSGYRILLQSGALDYEGPSATADPDGSFQIGSVAPGRYTLAVFAPFSILPKLRRPLEVDEALGQSELRLFLDGVDLSVLARVDGRPAASAQLAFEAAHDEPEGAPLAIGTAEGMLVLGFPAPLASAPTDGGGFALLAGCPVGPGTATLDWNGGRWTLPVTIPETQGEPVVWNFQGRVLEGRVVDSGGAPLPGIRVQWAYPGQGPLPDGEARTDGEGRFAFSGLAPVPVVLHADDPERGRAEAVVNLGEPSAGPLLLRLGSPSP
ncbi:MAG: carboxypeptidase regulatory-like domain-containing protein [Acidobacteriota bacterium]